MTSSALCHEPIRDRSDLLYYTAAILAAVTGSFVVTRFAIRIYLGFRLGYDDWTTLATTALGAGSTVLDCVYLKRNGIGKDIWTLTPHQINRFGALFYASQNIYFVLVSMQKLIFIFFYLQIFPRTNIRYILWGTLGLNCIIGFVYTITSIFECTPISFYLGKVGWPAPRPLRGRKCAGPVECNHQYPDGFLDYRNPIVGDSKPELDNEEENGSCCYVVSWNCVGHSQSTQTCSYTQQRQEFILIRGIQCYCFQRHTPDSSFSTRV